MRNTIVFFSLLFVFGCSAPDITKNQQNKQPVDYVNPMIGSSNKGNTFPGAAVPWGMAHLGPHNSRDRVWSGSRYFYGRNFIYGFAQNHLSGVGCGDFANINLMPTIGKVFCDYYKNRSRYENEVAEAGYYACDLLEHDVKVEVSATEHSTISRYTFPESSGHANVLIDVTEGLSRCKDAFVNVKSATEVEGWNKAGGFCDGIGAYTIYFAVQFNKAAVSFGTWDGRELEEFDKKQTGPGIGAYMSFVTEKNDEILVKVGISYVSIENARFNLKTEQPGWEFDTIRQKARRKWNEQLSKIVVEGGTEEQMEMFYTGLYHSLLHPNIIDDVNGEYPAMITKETQLVKPGQHQYTVYSLWDTYRTLHPLLTLVYPDQQMDMVRTMVDHAKHGGNLPFWELAADETYVMNGDPAPIVIADTYFKGLQDFNIDSAYHTMVNTATKKENNKIRPMQKYFSKYGYIPWDDCGPDDRWGKPRMVSECLEYAYADWAISKVALELGHDEMAGMLDERSKAYRLYYDEISHFLRPRNADGSWYSPFFPESWHGSWTNPGFVEGNSWQYTFFVPHDIQGLTKIMGGQDAFINKLQQCFDEKNFTIDNEPDIAYPYLFTYVKGEEWRTQKIIRELLETEFTTAHGGVPGNDDAGTISAWYIFSAMGFYPDCPGNPEYRLGIPLFDKITIHLDDRYYEGGKIVIRTENNSPKHHFVSSVFYNDKQLDEYKITHDQLVSGGELVFEMGRRKK